MNFQELLEHYHKIAELEKTNLSTEELDELAEWAKRGYDDGEFPITKGGILRLVREVKELREQTLERTCPECHAHLYYHEFACIVDGQQTGEIHKLVVCDNCGYQKELE